MSGEQEVYPATDRQDVPDTKVGVIGKIMGQEIGVNVANPNREKCPPGYFWVNPYKKGFPPFQTTVQGHCRRAGTQNYE